KPLFQLFETSRPKRWGQNPNQLVILPIVIFAQSIEGMLGEWFRDDLRCLSELTKITACSMEDTHHRSSAVITPFENGIGERHEPPHQFECFGKIGFRHLVDDGAALRFEIFDQRLSVL